MMLNPENKSYVERAHELRRAYLAQLASDVCAGFGKFAGDIAARLVASKNPVQSTRCKPI